MSDLTTFMPRMVRKSEIITSSQTWTLPSKIIKDSDGYATITVHAAAGGGGGSRRTETASSTFCVAFGGSSGECVENLLMSVNGNVSITIGNGGSATASGTGSVDGNDGSDTVVGSLTLKGGEGGRQGTSYATEEHYMTQGAYSRTAYNVRFGNTPIIDVATETTRPGEAFGGPRAGHPGWQVGYGTQYWGHTAGGGGLLVGATKGHGGDGLENTVNFYSTQHGSGGMGYGGGGGGAIDIHSFPADQRGGAGKIGVCMIEWWEYE